MNKMLNAGAVIGAVALCAAFASGMSSATVHGRLEICNDSSRFVEVRFPERDGFSSGAIAPRRWNGPCKSVFVTGPNAWEEAAVSYVSPPQHILSFGYNPTRGAAIFVGNGGYIRIYN
ncbi:hypothetical protein LFM09_49715 [Lentzea alba]|uniref:hypothetical protein n=1 Tax=Lentzea alba TaxID=2714351 RepID=UPI0039BF05CB